MPSPTYDELKLRINELERKIDEYESLEKKISALSQLCSLFGTDHQANIDIVVQQTLEILSGTIALYHRFTCDDDQIQTRTQRRSAQEFDSQALVDMLGGSLKALDRKHPVGIYEQLAELVDEKERTHMQTFGLTSCIVSLVIVNKEIRGVLCLFDAIPKRFSVTDQRVISTLAVAIAIEEERGAAEKTIRDSEERYRTIVEDIQDGYYEIDIKGNFTFINDAFCDIFGYSKQELIGHNYSDFTTSKTARRAYDVYNSVFSTERPAKGVLWEVPGRDGSLKYLESSISLIKNQNGFVSGFRGVVRDMTERRQLEFQLQQAQKMEAIGTLAGGIAHEFNNILGVIIGHTEMALLSGSNGEQVKESLGKIWDAAMRARDVIEQIQTFSRHKEVEQRLVSIGSIVQDALKLLRAAIPKNIEIRLDMDCRRDSIIANTTQIHQVLINLFTNAAQAMQEGGGAIVVSVSGAELTDAQHPTLAPGRYVTLRISDTGIGISADDLTRIFDPFFSTKAVGKGTGMGLAIVHGIVRAHGGDITVSSVRGRGSVFTVYLPASEGQPSAYAEESGRLIGGSERILFVDDEASIVQPAKKNLERIGYHVTVATNPNDALAIFRKTPDKFDLVITDMAMPGMTGDKLMARLKKIRPEIPIVMCTGYCNLGTGSKVEEMGAKALVMKPFTTQKLALTIRQALGKPPESTTTRKAGDFDFRP